MLMLFMIIKFIAANPVDVNKQNPGVIISIPDCFPFCGVQTDLKPLEELKNVFQPCFPFCGVPVIQQQQLNNLMQVAALPSCFPNCGPVQAQAPVSSSPSPVTSLFKPCFPFCNVSFNNVGSLFPSCFPFCGVTPVDAKIQSPGQSGVMINIPDCFPFCGVKTDLKPLEELKSLFQPCFPFCGVPVVQQQQLKNMLQVAGLPACFPSCGPAPATIPSTPSTTPSLFEPCFPFCDVPFNNVQSLFPSCFPFCGVTPVSQS